MKLYRNIDLEELVALLKDKKVNPIFDQENTDSTYRKNLGKVTCWFKEMYALPSYLYPFIITADIDDSQVIGEGVGTYHESNAYDDDYEYSIVEVYTKGYTLDSVACINFTFPNNWRMPHVIGEFMEVFEFFLDLPETHPNKVLDVLKQNRHVLYDDGFLGFYDNRGVNIDVIRTLVKNLDIIKNIKQKNFPSVI